MESIGQRIRARRKELGLSVDDIAERLGKNRATIYRYESDAIKNLPISILEPLAKVLETTPADLLNMSDEDRLISDLNENMRAYTLWQFAQYFGDEYADVVDLYDSLSEENQKRAKNYMKNLHRLQCMDDDVLLLAAHEKDEPDEDQLKEDALRIYRKGNS